MQKHMLFVVRCKATQEHIHQVGGIYSTTFTGELGKTIRIACVIARLHL